MANSILSDHAMGLDLGTRNRDLSPNTQYERPRKPGSTISFSEWIRNGVETIVALLIVAQLMLVSWILFPGSNLDAGSLRIGDFAPHVMLASALLLIVHAVITSPRASALPHPSLANAKPRTPELILDDPRFRWKR